MPLNKPITVAPIAARYAALHNRAAMMGDDLTNVLFQFSRHSGAIPSTMFTSIISKSLYVL